VGRGQPIFHLFFHNEEKEVRAVLEKFEKVLQWVLLFLFTVIIVSLSLQIFYRYVLNHPLTWSEELARFSFMWMVFLGLGLAEKENLHIAVDYFVDRMPARIQKPLRVSVEIFSIVVLLFVGTYAIPFIFMQRFMRSVALNISMMYFSEAVPVGCFLLSIYKVFSIGRILKTENFRSTPGTDEARIE
jgi:TRAP-type C4-dicarboxylate transport system permease small subunit